MSWRAALGTDVFDIDIMMNNIDFPSQYQSYRNYASSTHVPGNYALSSYGGPVGYQLDCTRWLAIVPKGFQQLAMNIISEASYRSQGYNNYGYGGSGSYGMGPPFDINIFWGNVAQIIDNAVKSGILREIAGDGNDVLKKML